MTTSFEQLQYDTEINKAVNTMLSELYAKADFNICGFAWVYQFV